MAEPSNSDMQGQRAGLARLTEWFAEVRQQNLMDDDIEQIMLFDDSLQAEENTNRRQHGGSLPGKSSNISRGHAAGAQRIFDDYFSETPVYGSQQFRRRFRMRRTLFLRILAGVTQFDPYFEQKVDGLNKLGLSPVQKVTAAIRILSYGCAYDSVDEYIRIGESTACNYLSRFCDAMMGHFGCEYLRAPTVADLHRILAENDKRGFPGCIGSIDCYNWTWKNCPKAHGGSYKGIKGTSIVLEAAVSYDLWFWHAFFGTPGALNDINVLQRSPLLQSFFEGTAHKVEFTLNGQTQNLPYWLADGIYPNWPVFAKTIPDPQGPSRQFYSRMQESVRKDIERAFGVLQARFAIVRNPGRAWSREKMTKIMMTCIILHNMIVEDERELHYLPSDFVYDDVSHRPPNPPAIIRHSNPENVHNHSLADIFERMHDSRDFNAYVQLQTNLVAHLWQMKGQGLLK